MYELPYAGYTNAQIKEEMYHFLNQLANLERLDDGHTALILKYLDIVSKEETLKGLEPSAS